MPVINKLKVNDVIKRIEELTNTSYMIFIDGQVVDRETEVKAAIKKDSKVLLFSHTPIKIARPGGIRSWYRFPKIITINE